MKSVAVQLAVFGMVGILTLLVDVAVSYILYNFFNMPAFFASGLGFLSGFCVNFPMNRRQVFQHSKDDRFSLRVQIILYTVLSIFNLFATSAVVDSLVRLSVVEIQWAKIVVTAIFAIWNFIIFKLYIFSKKQNH